MLILWTTVRECQARLQTGAGTRFEACKGLATAWVAAPSAKQQLSEPRASYRILGAVRELRQVLRRLQHLVSD
jgi:hypothetical protein